ncbi:hypothetical protein [Embleya sp. NPDC059237]|uniref:hypothetical protein n=1 Tax=Embleya sp. NPDC059237 TaxID=3346784 RepID=UPI00369EF83C
MDINDLFTEQGLRTFTQERRDLHLSDAREYGQLAQVLRRRLEQTPLDGDGMGAAWWRARRIYRHLRKMERASARAGAQAEALYTAYVQHVLEEPQRRAVEDTRREERRTARLDRNAERRRAAGAVVGGSLAQSARALHAEGSRQRHLDAEPHLYTVADEDQAAPVVPSVVDFFPPKRGGQR